MFWRLGWSRGLCASFENSATQTTATGHFVEQRNSFYTQSIAALGIFMPNSHGQYHCRSPPASIEN